MANADREKWNRRYAAGERRPSIAARVLSDNLHLLPPRADALDLACGTGANALLLARLGFNVTAWDISDVALGELRGDMPPDTRIRCEQRDVTASPPSPSSFDVIVVSHFLDRLLCPRIEEALRPGGLLFYQTYAGEAGGGGPANPAYRLRENELPGLFPRLRVLLYRDEGDMGETPGGLRHEAMLVAQRPS